MVMLRTPLPNAHLSRLEMCGSAELLEIFRFCLKSGTKKNDFGQLSNAWGKLFSDISLTAEELTDEMQQGKHRLSDAQERMLREFIRADCAGTGSFIVKVIKNGGKIDRAALIMFADLEDLASIEHNGMTAIHLLVMPATKR